MSKQDITDSNSFEKKDFKTEFFAYTADFSVFAFKQCDMKNGFAVIGTLNIGAGWKSGIILVYFNTVTESFELIFAYRTFYSYTICFLNMIRLFVLDL